MLDGNLFHSETFYFHKLLTFKLLILTKIENNIPLMSQQLNDCLQIALAWLGEQHLELLLGKSMFTLWTREFNLKVDIHIDDII